MTTMNEDHRTIAVHDVHFVQFDVAPTPLAPPPTAEQNMRLAKFTKVARQHASNQI